MMVTDGITALIPNFIIMTGNKVAVNYKYHFKN